MLPRTGMSAQEERAKSPKDQELVSPPSHAPNGGPPRRADELGQLMKRYARGEDSVFEELYRLLAPRVYRFCSRLAMDQQEADDCFQETLLRIHRARDLPGWGRHAALGVRDLALRLSRSTAVSPSSARGSGVGERRGR
jgi:hypothetical protein